ncbi:hypothetical protein V8G54_012990 [Vigna mungo]|uniref:Uncharacterized protein n=1 Tax=Vigna mungo TaxID=3915 RepID=A0AAQ3S4I6_VIGMU
MLDMKLALLDAKLEAVNRIGLVQADMLRQVFASSYRNLITPAEYTSIVAWPRDQPYFTGGGGASSHGATANDDVQEEADDDDDADEDADMNINALYVKSLNRSILKATLERMSGLFGSFSMFSSQGETRDELGDNFRHWCIVYTNFSFLANCANSFELDPTETMKSYGSISTGGVRIGTPAMTSRGCLEEDVLLRSVGNDIKRLFGRRCFT